MKTVLLLLIKAYQRLLSPYVGQHCRFYPTCSQFAAEAIGVHGSLRGGFYTLKRLFRCHPWQPGGIDWVPAAKQSNSNSKVR